MKRTSQRKQFNRHAHRYFSLMELMVVLLIIGLVVGLVGPALFTKYQEAQSRAAEMQAKLLKECVKGYYLDMNEYPDELVDLVQNPNSNNKWKGPYIEDGAVPKDPWGNEYRYEKTNNDGHAFEIHSYGRDDAPGGDGADADISCWPKE